MDHREAVLSQHGYDVRCEKVEKYRGGGEHVRCVATKDGLRYFAFQVRPPDRPEHHRRICGVQGAIKRMARIVEPIEDVVLVEEARGEMLWHTKAVPDASALEAQLLEFALSAGTLGLVHGDLRPWNVFFDRELGVQVIDWSLSAFIDDLVASEGAPPRRLDLLNSSGVYSRFHLNLVVSGDFARIDVTDALKIGQLVRGELFLNQAEAWNAEYSSLGKFPWQMG